MKWFKKTAVIMGCAALLMTGSMPAHAEGTANYTVGAGQAVELDQGIATVTLKKGMEYINGTETKAMITRNGGKPSGSEIGTVIPEDGRWFLYFEYTDSGHIKDSDKNEIDADELLQSYKDGQEEANKEMTPENHLFVDGWDVAPKYDETARRVVWSLLLHDKDNASMVNYNERILTREGYVSAILVCDPKKVEASRKEMNDLVLSTLKIKEGKRYEDFNESTDKVAEYGLAGLILGGAGVAVAKKVGLIALALGLFKKFWIVIVAVIAGLWKLLTGKKRNKEQEEEEVQSAAGDEQSASQQSSQQPPSQQPPMS
ncbi:MULTISPECIES: DUF2167 domain-containing protein [Paenibacillus]|nr:MULTISPECIES: DUF2167 domain-containing protein [Paenibacillus]MCY9528501.1 DUF2167 domain-containing protein [Paenibacillus alvei]